jgi:hypothetical protein
MNYNYEDVLSAVNALCSRSSMQVPELDRYLKGFQKSGEAWVINVQMLSDSGLSEAVP